MRTKSFWKFGCKWAKNGWALVVWMDGHFMNDKSSNVALHVLKFLLMVDIICYSI